MSTFIKSSDIMLFVIVLVWTLILLLKSVQPKWLSYNRTLLVIRSHIDILVKGDRDSLQKSATTKGVNQNVYDYFMNKKEVIPIVVLFR